MVCTECPACRRARALASQEPAAPVPGAPDSSRLPPTLGEFSLFTSGAVVCLLPRAPTVPPALFSASFLCPGHPGLLAGPLWTTVLASAGPFRAVSPLPADSCSSDLRQGGLVPKLVPPSHIVSFRTPMCVCMCVRVCVYLHVHTVSTSRSTYTQSALRELAFACQSPAP